MTMNTNKSTPKNNKKFNKGNNNQQKNGKPAPSMKNKAIQAARDIKAAKDAERNKQREEDLSFLKLVCTALDDKIESIAVLRNEAQDPNKIDKELTIISQTDILKWFEDHGQEFPERNKVGTLTSILVDLARCQVNTKLLSYHVALRLAYFGEKFQAYFSPGFDDRRDALVNEFSFLFASWDSAYIAFSSTPFDQDEYPTSMPVNSVGIARN